MSEEVILFGVPKVEYGANGITPYPVCLKSCADYLGQDVSYDYIMAASGAAFRLTWDNNSWNCGNVNVMYAFDDDKRVFELGIESLGCKNNVILRSLETKKEEFIDFIKERIDNGFPCIALGIVGPPEACIITVYRDNGNVLLGWSFFQHSPEFAGDIKFEENGYFITDKWWENPDTIGVMSLGEVVSNRFSSKIILTNAIEVMTGRTAGIFSKGIMAYDAWIKALSSDDDFSENSILPILAERLYTHYDALDCLADGRNCAAAYMKSISSLYPKYAEELEQAELLFLQVSKVLEKAHNVMGSAGRSENEMYTLAKPEVRKKLVKIINEAKEADEKALGILMKLAEVENVN